VTLYDLIPAVYWSDYLAGPARAPERRAYRRFLERVASADANIAISHETADDARRLLDVDPARIHVVPLACPQAPRPEGRTPAEPYVLFAGGLEPHKNAALLIDAMAAVRTDVRLVMAGAWSKRRLGRLQRRARKAGSAGRIDWLGHVSASHLAALRQNAAAVLVPSKKEGFGLPVLEAMAAGTPVVASDTPALREVGAEAAVYLSPTEAQPWAAHIDEITSDPTLSARMRESGQRRSEQFSWTSTARGTRAVYDATQELLNAA
jgi:glycosyltransferase involved in cell wall biosynthesis